MPSPPAAMRWAAVVCLAGLDAVLATTCNGYSELCSRLYSNYSQIGSHDSAFVGDFLTDNQFISAADQLDMGIRFLQAQTHDLDGTIEMCHTSCLELDAGSLSSYLSPIKTWLDDNTDDVVTLLLTNGDGIAVADYADVFESVGLDEYVFTPDGILTLDEWPTLQDMIDAGTRLVVFMDYYANTSSVAWISDEFDYYFETPYDTTDPSFPECTLNRPPGGSAVGRMGIMNHFLDVDILGILIPDVLLAASTNSFDSIMAQADICLSDYGSWPTVVLLDWDSVGDAIITQNYLNGLS